MQEAFNLLECVTQIADRGFLHVIHFSITNERSQDPGIPTRVGDFPATLSQVQIPWFLHPTNCVSATCAFRAFLPADVWLPGFHGSVDRFMGECAQFRAPGDRS